jgi:hypothetical protein
MNSSYKRLRILGVSSLRRRARALAFIAAAFALVWFTSSTCESALTLSWVNNSSNADGIEVERATSPYGMWSLVATVEGSATNYTDESTDCGIAYFYRVRAYNQAGDSDYSNTNDATQACCTYALSSPIAVYGSDGGNCWVGVTAPDGCAWTVNNTNTWVTIRTSSNETGNGVVFYSVPTNSSGAARSGVIIIGGERHTVMQGIAPCMYLFSPSFATYGSSGGSGTVKVTAPDGCDWTASSAVDWITFDSGASGAGSETISYWVEANSGSRTRTGTVRIGDRAFIVFERGVNCTYTLSSREALYDSDGGNGVVRITAPGGCDWMVNNTNSWIAITVGDSGTGNGVIAYSVSANTSGATRSGVITIGDQPYTVTQATAPCTYTLSSTDATYDSGGGNGVVRVTAPDECAWTVNNTNSWIGITVGGSGTGNGVVFYAISANDSGAPRSGEVIVGGQRYAVTQSDAP